MEKFFPLKYVCSRPLVFGFFYWPSLCFTGDEICPSYYSWYSQLFSLSCSIPKTSGGNLVYTQASAKLIYIFEIFLAWKLILERCCCLTACHAQEKGIAESVLLEWRMSKTEALPWSETQPRGKINLFLYSAQIIEYLPYAKLSARARNIKWRLISPPRDFTVRQARSRYSRVLFAELGQRKAPPGPLS